VRGLAQADRPSPGWTMAVSYLLFNMRMVVNGRSGNIHEDPIFVRPHTMYGRLTYMNEIE
jgi:hypothetical protein